MVDNIKSKMEVVGIDFGTFSNKFGCFDKYGLRIHSNNYKITSTPSVTYFNQKSKLIFGEKAVKFGKIQPNKIIFDTKTMIGRKFNDFLIQTKMKNWPFRLKNEQNEIKIVLNNDKKEFEFYPYEISGLILKNLVSNNNAQIVISKSENCEESEMNDLIKVAKFAGFHNFLFVSETVLASIAYLPQKNVKLSKSSQNFLIYDLGSSHLDVSIVSINDETYEICTEKGEINGQQFDSNIFAYVKEQMKEKYQDKTDFLEQPKTNSILYQKCEEAKIVLSEMNEAEINIFDDENRLNFNLTIEKFNEINKKLFEKSMIPVKKVLEKAKINVESIDDLFLVGGSTFIKKIRKLLFDTIKKVPCSSVDPREAVAIGACIAGAWIKYSDEKFNPVVDILMSKSIEKQNASNSENKNQSHLMQNDLPNTKENESSSSEIYYFWFNKNKKQKQNENEKVNEFPQNQMKSLKQNQLLSVKNYSPKSNKNHSSPQVKCLEEPKENESPKSKINYFWFNENNSPESISSQHSIQSKEDQCETSNKIIDLSSSDENDVVLKYIKEDLIIHQSDLSISYENYDLSNSDEINQVNKDKVPLYVSLQTEENQSKCEKSFESPKNICSSTKSEKELTPHKLNDSQNNSKTKSKQNTPKSDINNSNNENITDVKSTRSPHKSKQKSDFTTEKEPESNQKKKKSETKTNPKKVSIYSNFEHQINSESMSKPLKKSNFNIYQNCLIDQSNKNGNLYNQKKSNHSQKTNVFNISNTSNSTKIFFKIQKNRKILLI